MSTFITARCIYDSDNDDDDYDYDGENEEHDHDNGDEDGDDPLQLILTNRDQTTVFLLIITINLSSLRS